MLLNAEDLRVIVSLFQCLYGHCPTSHAQVIFLDYACVDCFPNYTVKENPSEAFDCSPGLCTDTVDITGSCSPVLLRTGGVTECP